MKIIAFTIADKNNLPLAKKMIRSFHHFHPDIEVKIYGENQVGAKENYYRATPMFSRELVVDYDVVIKLDADQIITGDLTHVLEQDYDVGGVFNFSRADVQKYGPVSTADIPVNQYFNCGFVVMKSKFFIDHWWALCNSYHFKSDYFRFKEQDLLNIMIHFGHYKVLAFDDHFDGYSAWHGLLSKGEWHRMEVRDNKLILPIGDDGYPNEDKEIKVMHWAGGGNEPKLNYRVYCSDEVVEYLDNLVMEKKNGKAKKT